MVYWLAGWLVDHNILPIFHNHLHLSSAGTGETSRPPVVTQEANELVHMVAHESQDVPVV